MGDAMPRLVIAVIGAGECDDAVAVDAYQVGRLIAERGAILVTGGRTGVMEAASRGAHDAGGLVVGILPGLDPAEANQAVEFALPTGMGQLRNGLVISSAQAVIAVAGGWGTLSEIGFARKLSKPVVGLNTWILTPPGNADESVVRAANPSEAVHPAFLLCEE